MLFGEIRGSDPLHIFLDNKISAIASCQTADGHFRTLAIRESGAQATERIRRTLLHLVIGRYKFWDEHIAPPFFQGLLLGYERGGLFHSEILFRDGLAVYLFNIRTGFFLVLPCEMDREKQGDNDDDFYQQSYIEAGLG